MSEEEEGKQNNSAEDRSHYGELSRLSSKVDELAKEKENMDKKIRDLEERMTGMSVMTYHHSVEKRTTQMKWGGPSSQGGIRLQTVQEPKPIHGSIYSKTDSFEITPLSEDECSKQEDSHDVNKHTPRHFPYAPSDSAETAEGGGSKDQASEDNNIIIIVGGGFGKDYGIYAGNKQALTPVGRDKDRVDKDYEDGKRPLVAGGRDKDNLGKGYADNMALVAAGRDKDGANIGYEDSNQSSIPAGGRDRDILGGRDKDYVNKGYEDTNRSLVPTGGRDKDHIIRGYQDKPLLTDGRDKDHLTEECEDNIPLVEGARDKDHVNRGYDDSPRALVIVGQISKQSNRNDDGYKADAFIEIELECPENKEITNADDIDRNYGRNKFDAENMDTAYPNDRAIQKSSVKDGPGDRDKDDRHVTKFNQDDDDDDDEEDDDDDDKLREMPNAAAIQRMQSKYDAAAIHKKQAKHGPANKEYAKKEGINRNDGTLSKDEDDTGSAVANTEVIIMAIPFKQGQDSRGQANKEGIDRSGGRSTPDYDDMGSAIPSQGKRDYATSQGNKDYSTDQSSSEYPMGQGSRDYPTGRSNKDYPMVQGSREYPTGQGSREYPTGVGNKDYHIDEDNKDSPIGQVNRDYYPTGRGSRDYPTGRSNKDYPMDQGRREYPADQDNIDYPMRQGSRDYPIGQDSRNYPKGQGSREYPTGQGNKDYPIDEGNRDYPVGLGNKDIPRKEGITRNDDRFNQDDDDMDRAIQGNRDPVGQSNRGFLVDLDNKDIPRKEDVNRNDNIFNQDDDMGRAIPSQGSSDYPLRQGSRDYPIDQGRRDYPADLGNKDIPRKEGIRNDDPSIGMIQKFPHKQDKENALSDAASKMKGHETDDSASSKDSSVVLVRANSRGLTIDGSKVKDHSTPRRTGTESRSNVTIGEGKRPSHYPSQSSQNRDKQIIPPGRKDNATPAKVLPASHSSVGTDVKTPVRCSADLNQNKDKQTTPTGKTPFRYPTSASQNKDKETTPVGLRGSGSSALPKVFAEFPPYPSALFDAKDPVPTSTQNNEKQLSNNRLCQLVGPNTYVCPAPDKIDIICPPGSNPVIHIPSPSRSDSKQKKDDKSVSVSCCEPGKTCPRHK